MNMRTGPECCRSLCRMRMTLAPPGWPSCWTSAATAPAAFLVPRHRCRPSPLHRPDRGRLGLDADAVQRPAVGQVPVPGPRAFHLDSLRDHLSRCGALHLSDSQTWGWPQGRAWLPGRARRCAATTTQCSPRRTCATSPASARTPSWTSLLPPAGEACTPGSASVGGRVCVCLQLLDSACVPVPEFSDQQSNSMCVRMSSAFAGSARRSFQEEHTPNVMPTDL